jgi:hypothetical protein
LAGYDFNLSIIILKKEESSKKKIEITTALKQAAKKGL